MKAERSPCEDNLGFSSNILKGALSASTFLHKTGLTQSMGQWSPGRDVDCFPLSFQSCYHNFVCGGHRLSCGGQKLVYGGHKLVCGGHKLVSGSHRLLSGGHRLLSRSHKLVSGGKFVYVHKYTKMVCM